MTTAAFRQSEGDGACPRPPKNLPKKTRVSRKNANVMRYDHRLEVLRLFFAIPLRDYCPLRDCIDGSQQTGFYHL